jgi:PAS domain S-box-containing protein
MKPSPPASSDSADAYQTPDQLRWGRVQRYSLPALSVALALGAALLLDHFGIHDATVPLFICACAISSWYGGRGSAVLAVILCSLAFDYFFVPPLYAVSVAPKELPAFIIFVLFTSLTSWFATVRRRIEEDLRSTRNELESLNHQLAERSERTETSLAESKARFEEAQRISHVGYWERDLVTGRITWSDETYRIFGLQPQEQPLNLNSLKEKIHPEDWRLVSKALNEALGTAARFNMVYRVLRSTGEMRVVHSVGNVKTDTSGRPILMFGIAQDVTEGRQAEQERERLRQLEGELARLGTLNGLTASIAHEISQPLASLIANASICLRRLNADPPNIDGARETARRTIRDGNRASDVITRLRDLYKKKEFAREPLDLNEATREVITMLSDHLQQKRVLLLSDYEADLPAITGDRTQIQQVIMNLLRNASDAMSAIDDRPRELLIKTAREEGDQVRLSVIDAGVGFEPQAADRLFQAFYTTKNDGMGIGLSISRSIIEAHGGHLWAEPNIGPGATFSFSIPSRQALPGRPCFAIGFISNGEELSWMPKVREILQDEFPNVSVETSTQFSPYLAQDLSKGMLDAALLRREEGWPNLTYQTLLTSRMIVYLPRYHRLAAFQEISPQDLVGETYLTVAKTAPILRRAIDDYLKRSEVSIDPNFEVDHPAKAVSLIVSTGCVSILPPYLLSFLPESITTRPLKGDPPTIDLVLGYNSSNQSPVLKFLLSRLGELVTRVTKVEAVELPNPADQGTEISPKVLESDSGAAPNATCLPGAKAVPKSNGRR